MFDMPLRIQRATRETTHKAGGFNNPSANPMIGGNPRGGCSGHRCLTPEPKHKKKAMSMTHGLDFSFVHGRLLRPARGLPYLFFLDLWESDRPAAKAKKEVKK